MADKDVKNIVESMKAIYRVNLCARPGERVLVFTDLIRDGETLDPVERSRREGLVRLARAAREAGALMGLDVLYDEFPALGSHGSEPPENLWRLAFGDDALDGLVKGGLLGPIWEKRADEAVIQKASLVVEKNRMHAARAVIALSNYSTSHTRFRDLLTSVAGARYASMPLFEEDMLSGSMGADWAAVKERSDKIAEAINAGDSVRVTTEDGTDITFDIRGRKAMTDTGMLCEPGSFSNLPAGEVYIAPVEGTAEGVLVLNWAPNRRLASPLRVIVHGGLAREVLGDEPFKDELVRSLERAPDNRNLAELGIGTNDKATRPDNILESEKILGTVHMAFGDNSSMGGRVSTPFHQDFVFFRPTLAVRGPRGESVIISAGHPDIR
jgi:aminopeptidase